MGRLYDIRLQPYSWIHGLSFSEEERQRYIENVLNLLGTYVTALFDQYAQFTNVNIHEHKHSGQIEKFTINTHIQISHDLLTVTERDASTSV